MDSDCNEIYQIDYIGNIEEPADYIDALTALGWSTCLVLNRDGSARFMEGYPDLADAASVVAGKRVSGWWMATQERRDAVKLAMRCRGLVRAL